MLGFSTLSGATLSGLGEEPVVVSVTGVSATGAVGSVTVDA